MGALSIDGPTLIPVRKQNYVRFKETYVSGRVCTGRDEDGNVGSNVRTHLDSTSTTIGDGENLVNM